MGKSLAHETRQIHQSPFEMEGRASARPGRAEARPSGDTSMRATPRVLKVRKGGTPLPTRGTRALPLHKLSDEIF